MSLFLDPLLFVMPLNKFSIVIPINNFVDKVVPIFKLNLFTCTNPHTLPLLNDLG